MPAVTTICAIFRSLSCRSGLGDPATVRVDEDGEEAPCSVSDSFVPGPSGLSSPGPAWLPPRRPTPLLAQFRDTRATEVGRVAHGHFLKLDRTMAGHQSRHAHDLVEPTGDGITERAT